jgi:SAM-dependent methyltransferase
MAATPLLDPVPRLTPVHVARLEAFLARIQSEIYPEPPSELHSKLSRQMLDTLEARYTLPPWARVLDVGCGQGIALGMFAARGYRTTGITLNSEDVRVCRAAGYEVIEMDQSFLDFHDFEFDLLWCRHCLEHSVMPLFTLTEFARVLRPGGLLYVEVPAPDTSCRHQANPNHYSVLPRTMWEQLLLRSGFELLDVLQLEFTTGAGPDVYWSFFARRSPGESAGLRSRERCAAKPETTGGEAVQWARGLFPAALHRAALNRPAAA